MRGFLAGIVACIGLALGIAYLAAIAGWIPSNADAKPSAVERWFARTALNATVKRDAPAHENPAAPTPENLLAGMRVYSQNCAVCHGGADGEASKIALGLYQRPPQLAKHGVEDDPAGETYWKIEHGIRLTSMPNFTKTLTELQLWQVTLFLQKMDQLPPAVQTAWKKATTVSLR